MKGRDKELMAEAPNLDELLCVHPKDWVCAFPKGSDPLGARVVQGAEGQEVPRHRLPGLLQARDTGTALLPAWHGTPRALRLCSCLPPWHVLVLALT